MAFKSPTNTRTSWPSEPDRRLDIQINRDLDIGAFPGTVVETGDLSVRDANPSCPPAPREMLELNDYRLALVPRNHWDYFRRSEVDTISTAAPTVLLAFSWKELVTQLYEFVRDSKSLAERKVAQFSDVCVDFATMTVSRLSGEVIPLTHQEFKTLRYFLSNPERVLSRDELLNLAWGYANYPSTRTVDNHVAKLRQKLEDDPAEPVHFRTVHGVGYKFVP
jgi:DNA-binding winged helix-turn-helix (wHTH) protein